MKIEPHHYGALSRAKEAFLAHAKRISEADPMGCVRDATRRMDLPSETLKENE